MYCAAFKVTIPYYVGNLIYVHTILGVDGWAARRLGQTSRFGAWLDLVVDNFGRATLWTVLYEVMFDVLTSFSASLQWGWLVSSLEWCVFVCNHSGRGAKWKSWFTESPGWVQAVMANGFKTPLGVWTVGGLHALPVWLYGHQRGLLSSWLRTPDCLQGLVLMLLGNCWPSLEMWCISVHVKDLMMDEDGEKKGSKEMSKLREEEVLFSTDMAAY